MAPSRTPETDATALSAALAHVGDRWERLKTLIRARLLVATLALPLGVLLAPRATRDAWPVLWWSLLGVGALSALYWLATVLRRGEVAQYYVQFTFDLVIVTVMAALTGGRESQFALFFALVAIAGGLHQRLTGGLVTAAGASLVYLALPWIGPMLGAAPGGEARPDLHCAFFLMVGALSGVLGRRIQRTRAHLERTARELNRVMVNNDLILKHLTSGVFTVDRTGMAAYLNPAAEEVLGIRLEGVRGRWIQDSLPERLKPLRDTLLLCLEQRQSRTRAEIMVRAASGVPLPLGISTSLLMHDDLVTGVVAVFQDLTAVREMERQVRRHETLAEVGALAAGIAHELRNGLNPISGSVECLQRELRLEGENAVLMDLIATESARLNRFVTDLLTYSRERDLVVELLDIDERLAELCDVVARDPRCRPGTTVRWQPAATRPWLKGDHEQLRQVWLNLATNALEAMAEGGILVVRSLDGDGDQVVVEFIDNGPGIAAEDLPRVGQPFFTTKRGGTGLGLAIAQRIVERHGGALAFESAPGRGTTARVTLPGATAPVALAA
ncbi:MAG: PAS domain S-box protein [Candidatus Eisenbacteria bacterium]|uniref:histidine kinase n=1 Tax=Eiseniibacteriota bacterium TaxID=2212470 RepID=A0A538UE90_UNCEI|nr:MAG: PAS domain S-box protein [Candidatus Eisenbacteria bacterium]